MLVRVGDKFQCRYCKKIVVASLNGHECLNGIIVKPLSKPSESLIRNSQITKHVI